MTAPIAVPYGMKTWAGETADGGLDDGPAPADWKGGDVRYRNGVIGPCDGDWSHGGGDDDIIAYTPRPDTPTGGDGGERESQKVIDDLEANPFKTMAARLCGEAFLMEDAANGHRKRVNVRTMQPVEMTFEQRVMVGTYDRAAKLMREAAALLAPASGEERLREALEPFAGYFDRVLQDREQFPDGAIVIDNKARRHLTYGDFRRARAALAQDRG